MEIAANAGVTYQGSTSQTENKVSTIDESTTKTSQSADAGAQTAEPLWQATEAAFPDKKDDLTVGETVSKETISRAVNEINRKTNTEAIFGIHEGTNHVTIKIIDKESKEVIKEYPPEKTLDMIAKLWEMAGILVDEKR